MTTALGIAAFAVMLIVVIMIHEAAHFTFAKRYGFKVEEFFVGFGPRLWSTKRGETEYGVKAIIAGGYVKIAGMNPFQPTPQEDIPRSYPAKPIWQRAVVIAAGPATHFAIAFILFALWLGIGGRPVVEIANVEPTLNGRPSPATVARLEPGDVIATVSARDGATLDDPRVLPDATFSAFLADHSGQPLTLLIRRDGRELSRVVTPVMSDVGGITIPRIGIVLDSEATVREGPLAVAVDAGREVWAGVVTSLHQFAHIFGPDGLGRIGDLLFTDAPRQPTDPTSVIGVGRASGSLTSSGQAVYLLWMFAVINIFIGLLNLLPLPPFDGGHLAVLGVEKVRGRPMDIRRLVPVSAVVLVFFVMFTAAVVLLDLTKPLQLGP